MKYKHIRDILFLLPPEWSHALSLKAINMMKGRTCTLIHDPVTLMGIDFPNRVGLAAGLDKNAICIDGLAALGFGFIEVGTVTPFAQKGNKKPRLFRRIDQLALVNNLGFNNDGVDFISDRIHYSSYKGPIGVNIGINSGTLNVANDYKLCMQKTYDVASYITINVSSPNTEGLRQLQHGDKLSRLLMKLKETQISIASDKLDGKYVPLVIKLSPDISGKDLRNICVKLLQFEIDGVIISNTSTYHDATGGISGAPIRKLSDYALETVAGEVKDKIVIIGSGGILEESHAVRKMELGADLIQLYTGFIYNGPDLITQCAKAIGQYFKTHSK